MPRQTLRSVRGRQPYVEAFPALDALALAREFAQGHTCCQWTNERGLVVGHIEITALSDDEVTIRSQFLGAPNAGKHISKRRFSLRYNRVSVDYRRPNLVCPDCGQSSRFLYMVASRWSCRKCHGLTLISQLLGDVTKYLRRLQELDVLLKRGRPHRGRKQAFAELGEEYWRLRKEFRDAPPLPEELRFAQYAEWLTADHPTLKLSIAPGEQGYGWTARDSGGFLRLTWLADQELKVHGDAERATRGRPSASTVKPRILTGPVAREAPFSPGSVPDEPEPTKPKSPAFRFDPAALEGMTRDDD